MRTDEIHIRDPFILPFDGCYYMYAAHHGEVLGFDVYKSVDLQNWESAKPVFRASPNFWGTEDFWAPEVHFYQGKFYLLASFKAPSRCRGTHILVSDCPDGMFTPVSPDPITPPEWECLDGTLYIDKKGTPYMVFCREWLQIKDGEICAVRLAPDLSRPIEKPRVLFKASEPTWAINGLGDGNFVTDGPFLYRTATGKLLMIWSSLESGSYVEAVAYSDNGEISGDWKHCDRLLFENDGGHGMLFKSFEGKKYFVFHSPNRSPDERATLREFKEENDELILI